MRPPVLLAEAGGVPSSEQDPDRPDMLMPIVELTRVDGPNGQVRSGRPMRASLAGLWSILLLAGGFAWTGRAEALDVDRVEWGFDGQVVPMVFNLLTVEVANNSTTPFEGNVSLQEGNGVTRIDLPLVERQLYIEPYGRRRLQFFPFITEQHAEFTLVWGDNADERYPVSNSSSSPIRTGERAVVLLRDASTSRQLRSKLPTFDEADFPISAAGLDALRAVVIDHVPRWDPLRFQALRDWIGAGGQLHLLKMDSGEYPKFPPPLEALNEPSDSVVFGNGRIFHHSTTAAELSDEFVSSKLGLRRGPDVGNQSYGGFNYQYQPSHSIAPLLRDLTRPDHDWALIYFLSFVYLLVVFPGCWLLGRRRADFRISYPALLAAVFLFSLAFRTVGQRGYGEETAWNAVGTARRVAPGRFLTETWSNAFVTSGGMYSFKHKGDGLIYSSGGSNDTRRGECFNRPAPGIEIEIPPFSSQTIMHTGIVSAPDFNLEFRKVEAIATLLNLEIEMTGSIPNLHSMQAVHGGQRVTLVRSGNMLRSSSDSPFSSYAQTQNTNYNAFQRNTSDPLSIYASAEVPLVVRNVWLASGRSESDLQVPKGIVRVFLYADMPPEFLEVDGGPEKRQGRLLYVFDHLLNE